jgi:hypothetical protein
LSYLRGHALSAAAVPRSPRITRVRARKPVQAMPFAILGLAGLASYLAEDWIAGLAILVLWGVWAFLREDNHPPVIPLALTFQWTQVTCGIYYYALTGRQLEAMYASDYRRMVLIGLGCIVALALGLGAGLRLGKLQFKAETSKPAFVLTWRSLFLAYVGSTLLNGVLHEVAWSLPGLTQGLLAIGYLRLGALFLMFRRLVSPRFRWEWVAGLLVFEVVLGFTGYFAGFREPLVIFALALIETFDVRALTHWMRMGLLTAFGALLGVMWIGIRTTYRAEVDQSLTESRAERLQQVGALSSVWFESELDSMAEDVDRLVERLWAIYYPALAVSRVPSVLPYDDGAILLSAVTHLVTPRILFPDKGVLQSDSELVRKYTGVFVAGPDQNTSIAFGYAAESYVDFGVPLMFVPSLIFGLIMGVVYRALFHYIRRGELAVGFACVLFWVSLYLFERSWVKTLGTTGTILIYLGGLVWLLDRKLSGRGAGRGHRGRIRARPIP